MFEITLPILSATAGALSRLGLAPAAASSAPVLIGALCLTVAAIALWAGLATRRGRARLKARIALARRPSDENGWARLATVEVVRESGAALILVDAKLARGGRDGFQIRVRDPEEPIPHFAEVVPSRNLVQLTLADLGLGRRRSGGLKVVTVALSDNGGKTFALDLRPGALADLHSA